MRGAVQGTFLNNYAGQVKIFLVLLVVFLAVAIYFNFDLLVLARNAVQEEAGQRLGAEADLVYAELERDQMLRGLRAPQDAAPYIPPTFLDRQARLHGMVGIDILRIDGTVLTSSNPDRVGREDEFLQRQQGRERGRLLGGATSIGPLQRVSGSRYATLFAYRPIRDRTRTAVAFIRVEREVPILASVDFDLKTIATLQAGGLLVLLVLVLLFARWLLQPYRRLQRAAGEASAAIPAPGGEARDEAEALVGAFQSVIDKMRDQDRELQALKERAGRRGDPAAPPEGRLIAGMSSAALVFDQEGRLADLNAAAARLVGLERRSALGRRPEDLLKGNAKLVDLFRSSLASGLGRSREVVPMIGPDGRAIHLGVMISPVRGASADGSDAQPEGMVCLLTDLTEIRSLRERARLRESLAALGEMSAGIAHEFRNALAAIQGYARLLERASSEPRAREHALAILREVGGVQKVVGDFLRFARPQTPDLEEFDLQSLVRDLASDFRSDPERQRIEFRLEGVFPPVVADETMVRQALQNLLRNAAEALLDRPATSPAQAPGKVVLRGLLEEGERPSVRLEVEDNGPGVSAADLPHIFTPFYTTRDRGTGLGLALVQKTAIVHDGHVEARSEPGQSTRIALVLPLRPVPPAAADLVA